MPFPSPQPLPGTAAEQVIVALRRVIRAIDLQSRALVQRCGITGPQLIVLREIASHAAPTAGELARAVSLSPATVTGILDRLESRGLVRRVRDTRDRRQVRVETTPSAVALMATAPPLLQEHFMAGFSHLADWEQSQILAALQRLVALLEAGGLSATPMLATGPLDATAESLEGFLGGPPVADTPVVLDR
jgi:DNA-binding MarR family transcriptional regulator